MNNLIKNYLNLIKNNYKPEEYSMIVTLINNIPKKYLNNFLTDEKTEKLNASNANVNIQPTCQFVIHGKTYTGSKLVYKILDLGEVVLFVSDENTTKKLINANRKDVPLIYASNPFKHCMFSAIKNNKTYSLKLTYQSNFGSGNIIRYNVPISEVENLIFTTPNLIDNK